MGRNLLFQMIGRPATWPPTSQANVPTLNYRPILGIWECLTCWLVKPSGGFRRKTRLLNMLLSNSLISATTGWPISHRAKSLHWALTVHILGSGIFFLLNGLLSNHHRRLEDPALKYLKQDSLCSLGTSEALNMSPVQGEVEGGNDTLGHSF